MSNENNNKQFQDHQKKIMEVQKLVERLIDATEGQHKLDLENPEARGKSKEELMEDSERIQKMRDDAKKTKEQISADINSSIEGPKSEDED